MLIEKITLTGIGHSICDARVDVACVLIRLRERCTHERGLNRTRWDRKPVVSQVA